MKITLMILLLLTNSWSFEFGLEKIKQSFDSELSVSDISIGEKRGQAKIKINADVFDTDHFFIKGYDGSRCIVFKSGNVLISHCGKFTIFRKLRKDLK